MSELGWDIDNAQAFAEQYREVVHEARVKIAGQTKAPDYSFRIGGQRIAIACKRQYPRRRESMQCPGRSRSTLS
jgi:hypothetical protein